ncbi:hypothetical protein DEU56DRAFT_984459 [Suillus clintonianus]|uniref:uncharacterized protein n=1 Tax=Suillus clintonianus TaxID=1904413 RepID=UPI001B86DF02|nr:uncharacterized protein DEU56DRAFT_984459 [Suillus clintonianus]KAG2120270.1 hypothetical protein DEU56DRAFT_984459 [Suillus clintonianus]
MHRALLVDDIIHTILQNLKSSRMDLRNVALTCSTLSAHALDMLWSEQSSLAPLIMCLPQDTLEVASDYTINLTREPTPMEWERVRIYASRIRRLLYDIGDTPCMQTPKPCTSLVLQRLFARFPPPLLFPNLCALDFNAVFDQPEFRSNLLLLRQFFSPGLEVLWFDVPTRGVLTHDVEQLVSALSVEASGLQHLSISSAQGISPIAVPPSLGKLPKLIQLEMNGINVALTRQSITNIQQSRCLQILKLTLRGTSTNVENMPSDNMPLELSTLKHLSLFGDCLPQFTYFLRQVTTPQLSSIHINYWTPASQTAIAAFMKSLCKSCQTSACLEEICVVGELRQDPEPDDFSPLPSHIFRPLLEFQKLSTLRFIGVGQYYYFDDAFIADAEAAWPAIRELQFSSHLKKIWHHLDD